MRKTLIAVLLCLNAGLFAALAAVTGVENAYAQYAGADYVAVTGRAGANDALYVIDLGSERLAGWRVSKINNQLRITKAANRRELSRDFGKGR